jgi:hypothetical protein
MGVEVADGKGVMADDTRGQRAMLKEEGSGCDQRETCCIE